MVDHKREDAGAQFMNQWSSYDP